MRKNATRPPSKIWRPTPQYVKARRASRCILIELESPEQRAQLKARAATAGVSMNRLAVSLLFPEVNQ